MREVVTRVWRCEAADGAMGATVLDTLSLHTETVLVDSDQSLIGDDPVSLTILGEGSEVSPQHQRTLDQTPESKHGPVLCISHPSFAHKQAIRIVPAILWALNTCSSVAVLIVDVNIPQQLLSFSHL